MLKVDRIGEVFIIVKSELGIVVIKFTLSGGLRDGLRFVCLILLGLEALPSLINDMITIGEKTIR